MTGRLGCEEAGWERAIGPPQKGQEETEPDIGAPQDGQVESAIFSSHQKVVTIPL